MKKKRTGRLSFIIIAGIAALSAAATFHGCGVGTYDTEMKPDTVAVSPDEATLNAGSTKQFAAEAKYPDGSSADITSVATWKSSNRAIVSFSTTTPGLATAGTGTAAQGTATITVSGPGGVKDTCRLTVVNLALQSIVVSSTTATIGIGVTQPFTATGLFSNGTTTVGQDITSQAAWTSSDTAVATIDAAGIATGVAEGTTTITAAKEGKSGTAKLMVSSVSPPPGKTITSIAVTPATASVAAGSSKQFAAVATYSDNTTANITSDPGTTWTSADTSVATVNNTGKATAQQSGAGRSTDITAAKDGKSGKATISVTTPGPNAI